MEKQMRISGKTIRTAASIVVILAALGGILSYVAALDARVRQLEHHIHRLTIAPAIAAVGQGDPIPNSN